MKRDARPNYKWEALALLALAYLFHQADRAVFGVVLPQIKAELALTDQEVGLVGTILFLVLAMLVPIAGFVADRVDRKLLVVGSLITWSAATLLTGFSRGVGALVMLRSVATAGGEAFYTPAAYPIIAELHHENRSFALSLHQSALYVGVMGTGFVAGAIAEAFGWRWAFFGFGAAGIALGLLMTWRLRPAKPTPPVNGAPKMPLADSIRAFFGNPTALLLSTGFAALVFVNNAYLVWGPEFLRTRFGLSLAQAGGLALFWHHAGALAGVLLGGRLSDRWAARRPDARIWIQAFGLLAAAPFLVALALAPSLVLCLVAMTLFGFFRGIYDCNIQASLFDVVRPQYRGSVWGLMVMVGFLIGSLSPWLTGYLREAGDQSSLSAIFASYGTVLAAGGLALALAAGRTFARDRLQPAVALSPGDAPGA